MRPARSLPTPRPQPGSCWIPCDRPPGRPWFAGDVTNIGGACRNRRVSLLGTAPQVASALSSPYSAPAVSRRSVPGTGVSRGVVACCGLAASVRFPAADDSRWTEPGTSWCFAPRMPNRPDHGRGRSSRSTRRVEGEAFGAVLRGQFFRRPGSSRSRHARDVTFGQDGDASVLRSSRRGADPARRHHAARLRSVCAGPCETCGDMPLVPSRLHHWFRRL